ncbi:MAG TPA: hypothetical protein VEH29_07975 [Acidimicrobiales bacterium]|nr:hypothetical protein [Acidimicrobiales bacterium]
MKKLITSIAVGLVAAIAVAGFAVAMAGASSSSAKGDAATTTTTLAPPIQGTGVHHLFFSVDTVQGYQTTVSLPADAACSITSLFQRGEVVVFRMWGVHVTTGGTDLTNVTVKSAFVKIPGMAAIPLVYGTHPTKPAESYWTAAWTIGSTYPLGVVNFTVTVTTDKVAATKTQKAIPPQTAVYTEKNTPWLASPLTITPSS